jgi:hypothetical protein
LGSIAKFESLVTIKKSLPNLTPPQWIEFFEPLDALAMGTEKLAVSSTACLVILIRRKGKYGDIEIPDIAGLLLGYGFSRKSTYILGDTGCPFFLTSHHIPRFRFN